MAGFPAKPSNQTRRCRFVPPTGHWRSGQVARFESVFFPGHLVFGGSRFEDKYLIFLSLSFSLHIYIYIYYTYTCTKPMDEGFPSPSDLPIVSWTQSSFLCFVGQAAALEVHPRPQSPPGGRWPRWAADGLRLGLAPFDI